MLEIDLKIFLRSLKKRPISNFMNLAGLSIGITCILLIATYLNHELSFDQHQPNRDRIYRMALQLKTNSGNNLHTADNFIALAPTLKKEFPEVEKAVRIFSYKGDIEVKYKSGNNLVYKGDHVYRTEQEIFSVFDHKFILGDQSKALKAPQSIVITESLAKKYFGNAPPLNKALILDNSVYKVTGVIHDLPKESDLYYEALASFDFSQGFTFSDGDSDWGNPSAYTYALLKEKSNIDNFQSKLNEVVKSRVDHFVMSNYDLQSETHIYPQRLSEIHFEQPILSDTPKGNLVYINILIILGGIIFLIVIFNYGNYSASYYTERVKEINIKKHLGANKKVILIKIISEILLMSLTVLLTSIILFAFFVPFVNGLTNNAIGISSLLNIKILTIILMIMILATSIASLYPITFLIDSKSKHAMSGNVTMKGSKNFRRSLLGVQFVCTTLLVFFSLTVYFQIQFLEDKNLGFDSNKVLAVYVPESSMGNTKTAILKNKLKQTSYIKNVSIVSVNSFPGNLNSDYQFGWIFQNEEKIEANFNFFEVDHDFAKLLDIEFLGGVDFVQSTTQETDHKQVLVNESFIWKIGFESPQKALSQFIYAFDDEYEIIGVIKNFHFEGIQKSIEPLVIFNNTQLGYDAKRVLVKLNNEEGLNSIRSHFLDLNPNAIFEYRFIDEQFAQLFHQERTIGKMTNAFCLVAVLLASLGLYSISSLTLEQRTKEIGIRKILGARMDSITMLLGKEFLVLVLVSFTVATPFSWYLANIWLEQFAYRIDIDLFIFITSILVICIVTISGIGVNLIKGINVNPVDMLKTN